MENGFWIQSINFKENLFNYLNNKYLWDSETIDNKTFEDEIIEISGYDIKVNRAYELYLVLGEENEEKFKKEIEKLKKNEESESIKTERFNESNEDISLGNSTITISSEMMNNNINNIVGGLEDEEDNIEDF